MTGDTCTAGPEGPSAEASTGNPKKSGHWLACFVAAAWIFLGPPSHAAAQTYEGDTWTTVAGASLGLYSGSVMGVLGTMMPCNRTLAGDRCVASGVGTGAAMGMVMGGLIGAQNTNALDIRAENAGIGLVAGAVVGVGLRWAVRQYGWTDVGTAALVGGAIGAAPVGSAMGVGAGVAVGALAWWLVPDATIADLAMISLLGLAVGGMVDWADGAASAKSDRPPPTFPLFTIHF
ncbi:MAG: hypothetical protein KJO65_06310 [Gemmatimonadetes bacterium]|nr:hypothetical protein [Gemmatimonadota bacterium]